MIFVQIDLQYIIAKGKTFEKVYQIFFEIGGWAFNRIPILFPENVLNTG